MYKKKLFPAGIIPMFWYLLMTFFVPLINNALDGYAPNFIEHSVCIVAVPLLIICLVCGIAACFRYVLKKMKSLYACKRILY